MICKKDVVQWFKELESYRRIETMCTLLNMCLPFELRFLGTCLEELGRRDSQELRGMELRANNPQDLATDMVACQKGEPTDKKIRRKMALYLALIRACNRTCVTEIFRTLDGWGDRDFQSMTDSDTLQELLLVYTMAANHPVFFLEQQSKFSKIFEKIKENKLVSDPTPMSLQQQMQQQQHMEQSMAPGQQQQHQQDIRQHLTPSHQEILQQHALHAMHLSGQHPQLLAAAPIHMLPQGSIPMNFSQQQLTNQIPVDHSIPHMISSNITIPADSSTILTHPGATWTVRPYMQPGPAMEHPPQSSSPMLSQQSSPSSSRATSPNRSPLTLRKIMPQQQQQGMQTQQQQQQQVRNMPQRISVAQMKNVRRPSAETTPPPMGQQQQQQSHQQMMSNEMILPQNIKHMDDPLMNNDGSGSQLQTLIRLNGFPRNTRIKAGNYIPQHPQQQQQQQSPVNQHYQANFPGLTYSMQNMTMTDGGGGCGGNAHILDGGMNSNKSAGSDSGSSIGSSGETSPPETPTLLSNMNSDQMQQHQQHQKHHQQQQHQQMSYNKQMGLTRLNGGRPEKQMLANSAGGGGVGNNQVSAGSTLIYAPASTLTNTHQSLTQQQSQQLFGTEIILAPGGNAGSANLMQTSMSNNNNSGGGGTANSIATSANTVSSNNNMATNTVLISSPSAVSGGIIGNVITSNSVILQPHQQQYNTSYPYHAVAASHLASSSRPPILSHNPGMAPPPPGTFRLPGFQLPPNGELIYPQYHPGGITFLSGAPQLSGAPPVALRSTNSASVSTNAVTGGGVPQQSQPPQSLQSTQAAVPNTSLLAASPYSTLTVGVSKPVSCYNCGSQTHSGQDCQEASMDDVTRSAIYKLDYSVSASSNASPTASTGSNVVGGSGGNSGIADTSHHHHHHHQQQQQHQKQHMESSAGMSTSSTSSTSTAASTLTPTVSAGILNTK